MNDTKETSPTLGTIHRAELATLSDDALFSRAVNLCRNYFDVLRRRSPEKLQRAAWHPVMDCVIVAESRGMVVFQEQVEIAARLLDRPA